LYSGVKTALAREFLVDPAVNAAWARQYSSASEFDLVVDFLRRSTGIDSGHNEREANARRHRLAARNIFVSYRREDGGFAAYALYKTLVQRYSRERVFFDLASIPVGVDFKDRIRSQIDESAVLLVVMGDQWLEISHKSGKREGERRIDDPDDYVRFEVELALTEGLRVIPVLIGSQAMLGEDRFPPRLRKLAKLNAAVLQFGPDLDARTEALIAEIGDALPPTRIAARVSRWFHNITPQRRSDGH
jgi:hypothetical protein